EQQQYDTNRQNRITDAGYDLRRFTYDDVTRRPAYVCRETSVACWPHQLADDLSKSEIQLAKPTQLGPTTNLGEVRGGHSRRRGSVLADRVDLDDAFCRA